MKKTRIILVGCGGMSRVWLEAGARLENSEIVALVDLDPGKAQARARTHGLESVRCFASLEAALAETQVDAVFDCTVPEAHYPTAMTALGAGCHLLSEKPLAANMKQAREMVEAAANDACRGQHPEPGHGSGSH